MKFYNSLTRQLEEFIPLEEGKVRMYTCGPTVYWDAHIGNFRSYVFEDVLQRALEQNGFEVKRAMNITDVGELTESGEDKMLLGAEREGVTVQEVAKMYTERFLRDAELLNIKVPPAPLLCKASEHIKEQIELIKTLEEKGFTYQISDGVYFDTSKFPAYGALSGQKLEEKEEGARVVVNEEKRNKTDFALWKFAPQDTKRQLWESPWGVGFPGWHIECSAMARTYLGQPFDIHCGGIDHIPVHHENEIAQSEAAYGVKLANFWLHGEFLLIDNQKMSKSLGNVYTLSNVIEHGFDPISLRLYFLGAHYRQKQNFTWDALQATQNALDRMHHLTSGWDWNATGKMIAESEAGFNEAIRDDLNTSKALAVFWKTLDSANSMEDKITTVKWMDQILGLDLEAYVERTVEVPESIRLLAEQRWEARQKGDWTMADTLRDELLAQGWKMQDGKESWTLERLKK